MIMFILIQNTSVSRIYPTSVSPFVTRVDSGEKNLKRYFPLAYLLSFSHHQDTLERFPKKEDPFLFSVFPSSEFFPINNLVCSNESLHEGARRVWTRCAHHELTCSRKGNVLSKGVSWRRGPYKVAVFNDGTPLLL